jgi:undecaprenyl pyrophosphate synthase
MRLASDLVRRLACAREVRQAAHTAVVLHRFTEDVTAAPSTFTAAELEVPREKRPRHIAVIMDGNGRWAERQNLPRVEGIGHRRCFERCSERPPRRSAAA